MTHHPLSPPGLAAASRITVEVRALEALDLDGLRAEWAARYDEVPSLRSPELLRLALAWRIQAAAFGGLDAKTLRRIRNLKGAPAPIPSLGDGAKITRQWQGRLIEVVSTGSAYVWNGHAYPSLSAVARAITGVRWNGPRFFGMRETAA
jgi:hypothetical protein